MSHKITYREYGEGPLVVLLHGYGGSVMHWDPLVEKLKTQYRVMVLNLSHVFLSTDKLLFGSQVELIAQFLEDKIEPEKTHFIGMSYGGAIAWALSLRHPEFFGSLSMINPMMPDPLKHFHRSDFRHYFRLPIPAKALALILATPLGKKFLITAAEVFREEKMAERIQNFDLTGRKLFFAAQMVAHFSWIIRSENWDYWETELKHITVPAQLIFDREDPLFNKKSYDELALVTKCQSVLELTGAGHLPVRSRPESIYKEISEFHQNLKTRKVGSF